MRAHTCSYVRACSCVRALLLSPLRELVRDVPGRRILFYLMASSYLILCAIFAPTL